MNIKKFICLNTCVMVFLCSLQGCKDTNTDVDMKYSSENCINVSMQQNESSYAANNLVGHGVCVLASGKNVGADSKMTSKASLIFNVSKQKVIYAHNAYTKIYPASITKIFTTLAVLKSKKNLDEVVTVSSNAAGIKDSGAKLCGFREGDKVKLRDLLYAMMIYSGNDAGVAIAEHVSGSVEEFAKLINLEAKRVGAIGTHMVNPHGLHDSNHYTTAYDIYLVFNRLLKSDIFNDIIKQKKYRVSYMDKSGNTLSKEFETTNKYVLNQEKTPANVSVIGGKTGTTNAAGNCLVIGSEDKKKDKYVSVVLNASSTSDLYSQMTNLLSKIR